MRQRATAVALVVASLLLVGPLTARGEEAEDLPDRFMIRGGWNYVFNADTSFSVNGAAGLGTTVDFSKTLAGQREDHMWRIDTQYRFNPRHSVGFSYYDVKRKGNRTLTADIAIGDTTYKAGGDIYSEINIGLYRFNYNYSFHHDDKVELAAQVGFYFADLGLKFQSNLTCSGPPGCAGVAGVSSAKTSLVAPLPTLGFLVNYHFTPKLTGQANFNWFYVEAGSFKGAMSEMYMGLEYRLFRNFGLGAAYNRLDIDIKNSPQGSTGWRIENDWNTLYLFGALHF
jgi:hypothetical protein